MVTQNTEQNDEQSLDESLNRQTGAASLEHLFVGIDLNLETSDVTEKE